MLAYIDNFKMRAEMPTFMDVWNNLVREPERQDLERAEQLEWLFKYHSTFMFFKEAAVIRYKGQDRWLSVDKL